jgi:PEP-CTERM motif
LKRGIAMKHFGKMMLRTGLAAMALGMAGNAAAAIFNLPVPRNAYITIGDLDWAWGGAVAWLNPLSPGDLTYQSTQGWRIPTAEEFGAHPTANQFFFAGANVSFVGGTDPVTGMPYGGGHDPQDEACAAAYFTSIIQRCDTIDGIGGGWANPGTSLFDPREPLYVRTANVNTAVPEPATWGMMLVGFGLVGGAMRRGRVVRPRLA